MTDSLGDRMKEFYEDRVRISLPRRSFIIIRIDGKAFHTYTKGLKRPFDVDLIEDMDKTAEFLCKNIVGAKLAYVQSDEISIVITDFDSLKTQAWFDNNLQKMCSVSASLATSAFNRLRFNRHICAMENILSGDNLFPNKDANFDSRVFQIPHIDEVINYLIWRQQDATRNSISSVAQSLYSHSQLNGKNVDEMQEMIFQKGQNWNNYPVGQKRGRIIMKKTYTKEADQNIAKSVTTTRTKWSAVNPPIFTQDKDFLFKLIMPTVNAE